MLIITYFNTFLHLRIIFITNWTASYFTQITLIGVVSGSLDIYFFNSNVLRLILSNIIFDLF
jgi:hypothetical protein